MRIVFNPKKEGMDHISIHNDNNKTLTIKFDENRFRHHTRLLADSGSIYEHIIQDKATDKLEAINKLMIDVCEDYGEPFCSEGSCDGDPGWEGCLTRKILDVLEGPSSNQKVKG